MNLLAAASPIAATGIFGSPVVPQLLADAIAAFYGVWLRDFTNSAMSSLSASLSTVNSASSAAIFIHLIFSFDV